MKNLKFHSSFFIFGYSLILLFAFGISLPAHAGKLYKWVDEKGQVHYGDSIPPEYAEQGRSELNKQGITVRKTDAAKTPEQLAEEERQRQLKAEEQKRAAEQAAYDRTLMRTYSSEDDILRSRDQKLAALDMTISITQGNLNMVTRQLAELNKRADGLQGAGKPLPEKLQKDIAALQTQQKQYQDFIQARQAEQDKIKEGAGAELNRYREIRAERQSLKP
ncbi:MAG: DUF4124 domain-containing protein [Gammaproteobacteria bacterium]|nr:DUF4124 domain-containing protein [Gammaproteobacteria bacterium]